MASDDDRVLILGGGLAGASAAHVLARAGRRVTLLEKEAEIGGLANSLLHESEHGRFWYDFGPHRFHSVDQRVHEETIAVLGDNKVERARVSRILLYDQFFDYPLKLSKALVQLPKPVMLRAIFDYFVQATKNLFTSPKDRNFEEWVVRRFGRKLYEIFFGVYTAKTWGLPCTKISADWASQRISQASLWDTIVKSVFRPRKEARSLVSKFHYPAKGGVGEIAKSFARSAQGNGAEVRTGVEVEAVLVENGRCLGVRARNERGETEVIKAGTVLNTMPLTLLVRLLEPGAPAEILAHVDALKHRSMVFVFLVLDRPTLTHDHWIYIPEDTLTVHRLSEPKNFSDDCAPADKTLICAEITCDFGDEIWTKTDSELREVAVRDLVKIGLIKPEEVLETFSHRELFAYPLYDLEYREHLEAVLAHADGIAHLDTTGRQGLFKYNNMDHSIAMGFTAADNLLGEDADHRQVATGDTYFG
ncbi:MAG: FAD-dependent oxidoreductase [Planctomycetes bacterium]|nr:FAD-dependent oxidoreductase [Planctomycetota bacterium]